MQLLYIKLKYLADTYKDTSKSTVDTRNSSWLDKQASVIYHETSHNRVTLSLLRSKESLPCPATRSTILTFPLFCLLPPPIPQKNSNKNKKQKPLTSAGTAETRKKNIAVVFYLVFIHPFQKCFQAKACPGLLSLEDSLSS